jgi:hypothetical protein
MGSVNAAAVIAVKQVTPTRLRLKHAVPAPGAKAIGRSAWICALAVVDTYASGRDVRVCADVFRYVVAACWLA